MLAIQAAAEADATAGFVVDVDALTLSSGDQQWPLTLAAGPKQMLLSGQWDATGQLLANDDALKATAQGLPYLRQFQAA